MTAGVRAMAPSMLETHGGKELIMTREEAIAKAKRKKGYVYVPLVESAPKPGEVVELDGKRTRQGGYRRQENTATNRQDEPALGGVVEGRGLKRKSISVNRDEARDFQGRGGEQGYGEAGYGIMSRDDGVAEKVERRELRKRLKLELARITAVRDRVMEKLASGSQVSGPSHGRAEAPKGLNGEHNSFDFLVGGAQKSFQQAHGGESGLSRGGRAGHGHGGQIGQRPEPRQLNSIQVTDTTPGVVGREKRTPKASARLADFETGNDKRLPAEKSKIKGKFGAKKVGQTVAAGGAGVKRKGDEKQHTGTILDDCYSIMTKMMQHKQAFPFNEPVDPVKLNIPDYFKVIKDPMDFRTIKERLELNHYTGPEEFESDMRLVFSNCFLFNQRESDVYKMGEVMQKLFERHWKPVLARIAAEADAHAREGDDGDDKIAGDMEEGEELKDMRKKKPRVLNREEGKPGVLKPVKSFGGDSRQAMTFDEKRKLSVNLGKLPSDKLGRIVAIISERNPDFGGNGDEIELDIDSLDDDTLWQLNRYVANCMKSKSKDKKREEQREVQREPSPQHDDMLVEGGRLIEGESGKDNQVEGEVERLDGVGRKVPSRATAPEADKDQAGYASRSESSSGSSSGESSSSDSDSDSGSSSGSESEPEDVQSADAGSGTPAHPPDKAQAREVGAAGAGRGPSGTSAPKPDSGKRVGSPGDGDATSHLKAGAVSPRGVGPEPTSLAEPESTAREPSPEDLRRKELMGRFAHVIAKATVEVELNKQNSMQGHKADPEKMRRDREEKERLEQLERERLKKEAAKAEEVRRKALAEARAENQRRIEAERQAQRQKLQEMERTVEIDGGTKALKELEMLQRNASFQMPMEAPASSGEPSPSNSPHDEEGDEHLQGESGSFMARFGLILKDDEEEAEEGDEPALDDDFSDHEEADEIGGVEADREEGEL
eukprot:TRINITY_DN1244_c0_g1_i1.p1 TRINITY_DN1244_c0_g1~~TRINITY_DN1244_c0_g1_i1.p1  ORF type:complete len:945 (-),score=283.96 TRINITY_DN1244_c0_g1_i1:665-3499(-)